MSPIFLSLFIFFLSSYSFVFLFLLPHSNIYWLTPHWVPTLYFKNEYICFKVQSFTSILPFFKYYTEKHVYMDRQFSWSWPLKRVKILEQLFFFEFIYFHEISLVKTNSSLSPWGKQKLLPNSYYETWQTNFPKV